MNRNEEANKSNESRPIPESSFTKPMDSKQDVANSPDERTDEDFPGYPHYPAKEDIMDQRSGNHRVDASVEDFGSGPNASGVNQRFYGSQDNQQKTSSDDAAEGESDDMAALDSREDERGTPQNVSNDDLNQATETGSLNP